MIDAHAHIQMPPLSPQWEALYDRAKAAGLEAIVLVGESVVSSGDALHLAREKEDLWATIGVHPEHAGSFDSEARETMQQLATEGLASGKLKAVGEIGLDYHWIDPADPVAKKAQWDAFEWQIELANKHNLPVVIHSREAGEDTLSILAAHRPKYALMHCYSYDVPTAERFLGLDERNMIAFTGILTYPNAQVLRDVCAVLSLDRMVTESDCPYLAPQRYRGQQNEPAYITEVVAEIARLKNTSFEQAAQATGENARRFFGFLGS